MQRIGPTLPGTLVDPASFVVRDRPERDRPWVEICMITTPDGATEVNDKSAGLGGPADQAMLRAWRSACDVILVGAGTVRAEGYGLPSRQDLRIAVVSRSCDMDFSIPLFASGRGFLVTTLDAPDVPVETVRAGNGDVDLGAAIARLQARVVHVEGGPTLNAALLDAGLVDAINLTFSPRLAGVHDSDPVATAMNNPRQFTLVDAAREADFVFARYERAD